MWLPCHRTGIPTIKARRTLVRILVFLSLSMSFLFSAQCLFADQIVLSNGDRLTGSIIKSDTKTLVIKTEFAGEVTVQWPAVREVNSTQPLHVGLPGGQTVVGAIRTADGKVEVEHEGRPSTTVPKDAVSYLRSDVEELAYEKTLHPGIMQGWAGGVNTSFALTRGNSATKTLALAFTAERKTLSDHIASYANTVFAANDAAGAVPATTANATQAGARYDHNIAKRVFAFGGADFQTDALQSLDLRSVFSGGLGWHLINTPHTTLDLLSGANYTRENYSTLQRNLIALTLGEELMHKVGTATVITQSLNAYPDLNETGEYRATFNFGTVTKLNKWLGWQNAFGDIYVTNPPLGKKRNDLLLTTGLNITFAH
jgi:putative salt-induced outer membrane protein YdiY